MHNLCRLNKGFTFKNSRISQKKSGGQIGILVERDKCIITIIQYFFSSVQLVKGFKTNTFHFPFLVLFKYETLSSFCKL